MNTFTGMKAVTAASNKFENKIKTTVVNLDKKELNELTELQKKLARRRQLNGESGGGSNSNVKSGAVVSSANIDDPDFISPRSDAALSMMDIGRRSSPELSRLSVTSQIESSSSSSSKSQSDLKSPNTTNSQQSIPTLIMPPVIDAAANINNSTSVGNHTSIQTQQEGDEIPPDSSHKSDTLNIVLTDRSHILSDRSSISEITNRSQSQSHDLSTAAVAPANMAKAISTLDDDSSSYSYNNSKNNENNIMNGNENDKASQLIHRRSYTSATPALSPIKEDCSVIGINGGSMTSGATSPVSASSTTDAVIASYNMIPTTGIIDCKEDSLSISLKEKLENLNEIPPTSITTTLVAPTVSIMDTTAVPHIAPAYSTLNSVTAVSVDSNSISASTNSPSNKPSPVHMTDIIVDPVLPVAQPSADDTVVSMPSISSANHANEMDLLKSNESTFNQELISNSFISPSSSSSSSSSSAIITDSNNMNNSNIPPLPVYVAKSESVTTIPETTTTAAAPPATTLTDSGKSHHSNNKRPVSSTHSSSAFVYNKEDEEKEIHLKMMQEKEMMESLTDADAVKAENMKLIEKRAELEKKLKYSTHKISFLEKEIEELRATIVSRGGGTSGTGNRSRAGSAASRISTGTRVGGSSGVSSTGNVLSAGLVIATNAEAHTASGLLSSPSRQRTPAEHMKLRSERNLLELRNEQRERSSTLQTTTHSHHTHTSDSVGSSIHSVASGGVSTAGSHTSTKRNTHTPMMDKYLTIGSSSFGFGAALKAAMSSDDPSHVSSASHPTAAATATSATPTTARGGPELGLNAGSGSAINDSNGDNPMRISPTNQPRNGVSNSAEHSANTATGLQYHNNNKNVTMNSSSSNDTSSSSYSGPFASLTSASLTLLGGNSSSSGNGMTSPVPLPGVRVPNAAVVSPNKAVRSQPQGLESQLVKLEESLRLKGAGNIDPWYNQPKGYLKKPANFKRPDQDRLSTITGGYGGSAGGGMRDSGKKSSMSILSHITQIFHFYHSRWFVLDYTTNLLSFYKDNKPGRVEKGNIHMENIIDIYTSQVADAPKYALDLISFDTRYTIVADSQESLVKWAFVLNMARKKNFRKGILRFNSISGGSGPSGKALTSSGNNSSNQPYNMNDLPSINNLAHVFESQGDYEQAEVYYKQYLEETRKLYGDDHVDTINAMSNLASLYQNQSKYDHAKIWNLNCIDTCRRAFGTNHVETLQAINKLAYLYEIQGQFENAEPLYVECSEIRKHVFNELVSDRESVYSDSGN